MTFGPAPPVPYRKKDTMGFTPHFFLKGDARRVMDRVEAFTDAIVASERRYIDLAELCGHVGAAARAILPDAKHEERARVIDECTAALRAAWKLAQQDQAGDA